MSGGRSANAARSLTPQLIDIDAFLDRRLSPFQLLIIFQCLLIVFLDGIDSQVIGIAAPLITADLGIGRGQFGWIISAGTLGATLGALLCGVLADRYGRKRMLICTALIFGGMTALTSQASTIPEFIACRFLTGIGLGGAIPCFLTLASEYAPSRHRALLASLLWAGYPFGAAIGAILNGYLIGSVGWRTLFVIWGMVSLAVAGLLLVALPDSLRFVLKQSDGQNRARKIIRLIVRDPLPDTAILRASDKAVEKGSLVAIWSAHLRGATATLAGTAFISIGLLTVLATWLPSLFVPIGYSPSHAAMLVAYNGFGSAMGTVLAGFLIERVGVFRATMPAAALAATALLVLGFGARHSQLSAAACVAGGAGIGLISASFIAMSVLVFPPAVRSTGIGFAMGFGRFGGVVMPVAVGMLVSGGWGAREIMAVLAGCVILVVPLAASLGRQVRKAAPDR